MELVNACPSWASWALTVICRLYKESSRSSARLILRDRAERGDASGASPSSNVSATMKDEARLNKETRSRLVISWSGSGLARAVSKSRNEAPGDWSSSFAPVQATLELGSVSWLVFSRPAPSRSLTELRACTP